ncbi:MAG TPA: O-antigen ligase family protein [Gaiellaceae bacterium]|nr:O-antigen ligase family protein [Gaiellaceae bacterium]
MIAALERRAALLALAAGGLLTAACVLLSAGSSNGRLVWLGLAALALAAALATAALVGGPRPRFARETVWALGLLVAFVCWCGISLLWSIQPDRTWLYLNRGLVYLALALVGLGLGVYVPQAIRRWAFVLAGVVSLGLAWGLLGKAVPAVGGSGRVARLSAPIGYWNAFALLLDFGLPLALWLAARREHPHWLRVCGVVLLYALVVGLLLTYSRGGVAVAALLTAAWLVLSGPRVEGAAALLLGGGAGLGVAVWAFSRPGLAEDLQAHSVRVRDGRWFAVVFLLGLVLVGALAYLGSVAEEQRPLDDRRRKLVGRIALAVLAVGAAAAVVALVVETKPQGWFRDFTETTPSFSATSGPSRLATINSSSRWQWWKESWHAFEDEPLRGTGAGTFELTHRLLRTNDVVVTEPHNLPLQFLTETGIVGFLLALGSIGAATVGVVRVVRPLRGPERAAAVALAVSALAYPLHTLVDFDFDFVAVSAPFFVSVGVLLGGRTVAGERRLVLAPLPVAAAILIAFSLLVPWFAQRDTDSALAELEAGRPAQAAADAHHAHSLNPLALDPLFVEAGAAQQLGDLLAARALYVSAVDLQPLNWRPWYELGSFEVSIGDDRGALAPLRRAVELDKHGTLAAALLAQVEARLKGG